MKILRTFVLIILFIQSIYCLLNNKYLVPDPVFINPTTTMTMTMTTTTTTTTTTSSSVKFTSPRLKQSVAFNFSIQSKANFEYAGAPLGSLSIVTNNARKNLASLSTISSLEPFPTLPITSALDDVDGFASMMLNATSFLTLIQGGLFSPNLFISNQTVATQMRTILSQHFTKFNSFFTRSYQNPLSYFELYKIFGELKGTLDAIFMFTDAVANNVYSGYDLNYMKMLLTILVAQDNRFFIKEPSNNKTASQAIFDEILKINSSSDFLKTTLNTFTVSQLEYFQNLINLNGVNKISFINDLNSTFQMNSTLIANLFKGSLNVSNLTAIQFSEIEPIVKYLKCDLLNVPYYIELGFNNSLSFSTATHDRILYCNPNLAFNLLSIYDSRKRSQTIIFNGNTMNFNKTFFEVYDVKMKQGLIENYIRYCILTGISINYDLIGDLLDSVSIASFEQSLIYSLITDTTLFNNLSFIPIALKSSTKSNVIPVLTKYSIAYLDIKINNTWANDEWSTFNAIMRSISLSNIQKYLRINKRYAEFMNSYVSNYDTDEWNRDCAFTKMLYNFFIETRDSLNDSTNINYKAIKKMTVCKEFCDFSEWTDKVNDVEKKAIITEFLPYLSSSTIDSCKGSYIFELLKPTNLSSVNASTLRQITNNFTIDISSILTPLEVSKIPNATLQQFIKDANGMKIDVDTAREIMKKIGALTGNNISIATFGTFYVGLPVEIANKLTTTDVRNNFNTIISNLDNCNQNQIYIIVNKYLGPNPTKEDVIALIKTGRSDLIQYISLDIVKNVRLTYSDISSLNLKPGVLSDPIVFYLTNEALKTLPIEKWTLDDLNKATPDLINTLPESSIVNLIQRLGYDAIKILLTKISGASSTTLKWIVNGLRAYLIRLYGPNVEIYMNWLDPVIFSILPEEALSFFTDEELSILTQGRNGDQIVEQVRSKPESKCQLIPYLKAQVLSIGTLKKLGLFNTKTLTLVDIDKLGLCMVSALPIPFLQKILPSVLVARVEFFTSVFTRLPASLYPAFGDILTNVVKNVFAGNVDEALKKLGKLAILIPKDLLQTITSKLIPFKDYLNCLKRRPFFRPFRTLKCVGKTFINNFVGVIKLPIKPITAVVKTVKNVVSKIRRIFRGKRDTLVDKLSCADIQSMGSAVLTTEPYELESMENSEFMKCLSELSIYDEWSADHLTILKPKLMSAFNINNTNMIDDDIIYKINNLALAFNDKEIVSWNINSLDTLSSLGSIENFNSSQLNALAKFIPKPYANLTALEISSIKNLICGMQTTDILSLNPHEFQKALPIMKQLTACDYEHFSALYKLGKASLNMTLFSKEYTSQLGNLIAGVTSKEFLAETTPDLVTSYSYSLFELLPTDVLNEIAKSPVADSLNTYQVSYIVNFNKNFENLTVSAQNKYNKILDPGFDSSTSSNPTISGKESLRINYGLILTLSTIIIFF